jgi:N-formylglutamate amidohydrolase
VYRSVVVVPPFHVHEPAPSLETPLVVEIPHAGLHVPAPLSPTLLAPVRALARDADLYVDELYGEATLEGATMLAANVSRYVIDLNRAEDDVDGETVDGAPFGPVRPRGLVWRVTTENERCLGRPLSRRELVERLDEVHRPYHRALRALVERKKARFGVAVILAAHSMPSVGRSAHGDAGTPRADVVPGTQGRTSAHGKLIDAVDAHARRAGLSVQHDEPYRGGFTTQHYGRPRDGVHVVQVELARRLYMDEGTLRKSERFDGTRSFCRGLVAELGAAAARLSA